MEVDFQVEIAGGRRGQVLLRRGLPEDILLPESLKMVTGSLVFTFENGPTPGIRKDYLKDLTQKIIDFFKERSVEIEGYISSYSANGVLHFPFYMNSTDNEKVEGFVCVLRNGSDMTKLKAMIKKGVEELDSARKLSQGATTWKERAVLSQRFDSGLGF